MGLLFQPRWVGSESRHTARPGVGQATMDREMVFLDALRALIVGDRSRFDELFTSDVTISGPHLLVTSRAQADQVLGSREDALADVGIIVLTLGGDEDTVFAEWRLEALLTGPVLFNERVLIEPTGGEVLLTGASVAEFREERIRAFRHYFDDSELLAGVPGASHHLRWTSDD